jgi:hypothetical protein
MAELIEASRAAMMPTPPVGADGKVLTARSAAADRSPLAALERREHQIKSIPSGRHALLAFQRRRKAGDCPRNNTVQNLARSLKSELL